MGDFLRDLHVSEGILIHILDIRGHEYHILPSISIPNMLGGIEVRALC